MQISTYIIINLLYQKSVGNGEEGKISVAKIWTVFQQKGQMNSQLFGKDCRFIDLVRRHGFTFIPIFHSVLSVAVHLHPRNEW